MKFVFDNYYFFASRVDNSLVDLRLRIYTMSKIANKITIVTFTDARFLR